MGISNVLGARRRRKTGWVLPLVGTSLGVGAAAATGIAVTDPDSHWYFKLRKPSWQPPSIAFPVVWTALYADIAVTSAAVIAELDAAGDRRGRNGYIAALAVNLALNAGWSVLFFGSGKLKPAAAEAIILALSSIDLSRRAGRAGAGKAAALAPYAAWTAFAAVLSGNIALNNPEPAEVEESERSTVG